MVENNVLPDCVNNGSYDNVIYCLACEEELSRNTIIVNAYGHTEVVDGAVAPTCTTTGLTEGKHCSVCNGVIIAQDVIPALGHRVLVEQIKWVESTTFENDAKYPFVFENGVYASTNHVASTDSYFMITALYDCTLNISYSVSSEKYADKLIIRHNGTAIVTISGIVDWASREIELTAGDVVTINYHKDINLDKNEDTGWFSFTCEQTPISTYAPTPADDMESTCTESVVCDFCQAVVKEALGHDELIDEAIAPTCTETGLTEGKRCSRCDYKVAQEVVDALGHDYVAAEINDTVKYTCSGCGDEFTMGDVNGDGRINGTDVTLLRRYITGGYGVQINIITADINGDGRINGTDVTFLRRYIAGGYGVVIKPSIYNLD